MPIQIIDGFKLGTSKPIDDRIVGSGSTFRDNITYKYDGLLVVDTKNHTPYVWNQDSDTWSSIIQTSSTNVSGTYESIKEITSNSSNKYVYVGYTNPSFANDDKKINIKGGLKSDDFYGNGYNITNINPSNVYADKNGSADVGQVLQLNSNLTPTWTTIPSPKVKIASVTSNKYYIGFIDSTSTSGDLSKIYYSTIYLDNGVLNTKNLIVDGTLTVSGAATFSRVAITDLNVSRAATFSRVAITDLNVSGAATFSRVAITDLNVSGAATFSRVAITDLNVSRAATFSRVAITDLSASAATFSRVAITDLNVSGAGTFSRVAITDLSASTATFSRVAITDLNVSRAATFSRVAITDLNVSGAATFSRVDITDYLDLFMADLNVGGAGTFSRVAITDLNVSGSATFSGNLSVIGNIFNRWKITFVTSAATYYLTPNNPNTQTTTSGPNNDNIFQASLHDIILYMYGGTSTRTYEITIYMELTNKDVYTAGNYYYAPTTLLTSLSSNYMLISSIKYILLNRFNNNGGYTSLSCIIPAGRRFLISVSTSISGSSSDITFTAMKFGR